MNIKKVWYYIKKISFAILSLLNLIAIGLFVFWLIIGGMNAVRFRLILEYFGDEIPYSVETVLSDEGPDRPGVMITPQTNEPYDVYIVKRTCIAYERFFIFLIIDFLIMYCLVKSFRKKRE